MRPTDDAPGATEPQAARHEPVVELGWLVAHALDARQRASVQAARRQVLAALQQALPEFRWRMPLVEWDEPLLTPQEEPVALLKEGARQRAQHHWDYALVITPADLAAYSRPQAMATPSRSLYAGVLSLSRIEMRAHVRPSAMVDAAATVRAVVELARPLAAEANVSLELNIVDEPLRIRGDADELVQLFDNLIENAIKYGGEGGRVIVSTACEPLGNGMAAVISVQDFGHGIAPEHVPRLTERFYRVDVEASRAKQGTGLGLAIVKHIVARHRGRLNVRSELGAGTTFTVRIPMDA